VEKLYTEELNYLHCSPNIFLADQINKNILGRSFNTYGEKRGVCMVLVENPEVKEPLERPRLR
jgi:hypothetical protein